VEGQVIAAARLYRRLSFFSVSCGVLGGIALCHAQGQPATRAGGGQAEMSLRKSVLSREFQGRQFAGEERQIGRGDSLWRILVEEKGLRERRFHSYLVVIRGLNPQIKSLDVLRVGDRIFIPLRLDDPGQVTSVTAAAADQNQAGLGKTFDYRIKAGEHLYGILREQLRSSDHRKLAEYLAVVKDLNPERKNWDILRWGEVIRLPVLETNLTIARTETASSKPAARRVEPEAGGAKRGSSTPNALQPAPSSAAVVRAKPIAEPQIPQPVPPTAEQAIRLPARNNMVLFAKVAEALGNEVQQSGEEVVALPDGAVRFDKSSYPVVYNAALRQRVVIDPDGNIPASLKTRLSDPSIRTPVLPMANGVSLQEAVRQLLVDLGYQPLPAENPVVVQQAGIAFEAQGDWMALAPEVSNKTQEVLVINIADSPDDIPEYMKAALAKQGLYLREIVLGDVADEPGKTKISKDLKGEASPARNLPQDKREIVDALLLSFGVAFGVAENISVELRDGLRVDKRVDRLFDLGGKRTALFFQLTDPVIRQALQDKHGIRTVDFNIESLSSRDVIARVLSLLGDRAAYREHRFSAGAGSAQDRLTVKAWGFHVARKAMFVTDRQIPPALHRFFFEKGLEIVYFR
jgi:hypothetical protein